MSSNDFPLVINFNSFSVAINADTFATIVSGHRIVVGVKPDSGVATHPNGLAFSCLKPVHGEGYTKTESWTGGGEKIRKELPTIRKMRKVDIWEERSEHSLVISS